MFLISVTKQYICNIFAKLVLSGYRVKKFMYLISVTVSPLGQASILRAVS